MDNIQNHKMHRQTYDDVLEFLSKWGVVLGYIIVGLLGKFGFDIVSGKRLSFWYVFGTSLIAFCIGFFSWQWCATHPSLNPGIVVPFCSLISRDIMLFVTVIDWQGVLQLVTGKGVKKDKQQ